MRRIPWLLFAAVLALAGCNKKPDPRAIHVEPTREKTQPDVVIPVGGNSTVSVTDLIARLSEPTAQEKYEKALWSALSLMAENKYSEALAALEEAKKYQDTEQVRSEIARMKALLTAQEAAEKLLRDIQTVLDDGDAEKAAQLASDALKEHSGTALGEKFQRLKVQAEALITARAGGDKKAQLARLQKEAKNAEEEKNWRALALALEQAEQLGDSEAGTRLAEVRKTLAVYDQELARARKLRQDPQTLEDAIEAYKAAQKAWDTLVVQRELAECNLALQVRRDRISVAEFEVRGNVGIPAAGRTIAEQLLPHFKSRFDLVEREQLDKVVAELKLQSGVLDENGPESEQVGKLARLRYLVVGSVTQLNGLVLSARLVDVRTGLVVQTATLPAATPDEALKVLPQLARLLLMNDDQKLAYEQELARQTTSVKPVEAVETVPPAPPLPAPNDPPPPPVLTFTPQPPNTAGVRVDDFDAFPTVAPNVNRVTEVVIEREQPYRRRLLQLCLTLGDWHFRSRRFQAAFRQYELALTLYPGHPDLVLRLDRCRPYLGTPIFVPVRPRLAILDFFNDPRIGRPGLGGWTATQIAPYFSGRYEIVDRYEVYWYMHRLGIGFRELMTDRYAQRWLSRALGVRYFLFGSLRAGSIVATTHLIDAEYGYQIGGGRIRVANPFELKLALPDLARLTLLPPARVAQEVVVVQQVQQQVTQAQLHIQAGKFSLAIDLLQTSLKSQPSNVTVQVLLLDARRRQRLIDLEAARRTELQRQQALVEASQRRQEALALEAAAARRAAEIEAARRAEAERQAEAARREAAYLALLAQGRTAFQQNNFNLTINVVQSALALKRTPDAEQLLALAQAKRAEEARRIEAERQAERERQLRLAREREAAALRQKLEDERQRRQRELDAQRKAQQERERAAFTQLLDQARKYEVEKKYDEAISALTTAKGLATTAAERQQAEKLFDQVLAAKARLLAAKEDEKKRREQERRLKEEKERAEAEARKARQQFEQYQTEGLRLLRAREYEKALAQLRLAARIYQTEALLDSIRLAEREWEQEKRKRDEERRAQEAKANAQQKVKDLLARAADASKAGNHDLAIKLLGEARGIDPTNQAVLLALGRAEQDREVHARKVEAKRLFDRGKKAFDARQWDEAITALADSVRLEANAEASRMLTAARAEKARLESTAQGEKQKKERFNNLVKQGQDYIKVQKYSEAIAVLLQAGELYPQDATVKALLRQASDLRAAKEKKEREEREKQALALKGHLDEARKAISLGNWGAARTALGKARALAPSDPQITVVQKELDEAIARADQKARDANFAAAVARGRAALTRGAHDEAIAAFDEALKIRKDPAVEADRQKAIAARAQAGMAQKDFEAALAQGEDLLQKKRHAEAIAAFQKALTLRRGDPRATRGLNQAQAGLRAEEERKKEEERAAQKRYDDAMRRGAALMGQKKYSDAIQAFKEALQARPNDPRATQELKKAEDLQKQKRTQDERNEKEYRRLVDEGRKALARGAHDEAIRLLTQASGLVEDDREARNLLSQAQDAKKKATEAAEAERRRKEEEARRVQMAYDTAMTNGRQALARKDWATAAAAFRTALRLKPNDPAARQGADEAARGDAAARAQAAFQKLIDEGKTALKARDFDGAIRKFQEALRLAHNDAEATRLLQSAQTAKRNAEARDQAYSDAVNKARAAMAGKRYAEAVAAWKQALRERPNDPTATRGLEDAQKALDASKPPMGDAAYDRAIRQAESAVRSRHYDEAATNYREAQRLKPNDRAASDGVKFAEAMLNGQRALSAKKWAEAEREFQTAVNLKPSNSDARSSLQRARQRRP